MNGAVVLLLQKAADVKEADRAWNVMGPWAPVATPSSMLKQVDRALQIVRGINAGCRNDPTYPRPHAYDDERAPIGPDGLCEVCGQPRESDPDERRGKRRKR